MYKYARLTRDVAALMPLGASDKPPIEPINAISNTFKSALNIEQSLPCFLSLKEYGRQTNAITAVFRNLYNGTGVDDCRSMQNLELPHSPTFLTVAGFAELLKVKPRAINGMVAQNSIPAHAY